MNKLLSFLLIVLVNDVLAQNMAPSADKQLPYYYDTDRLSPAFHAGRREALRAQLPEHALAVFFSNNLCNRSGDVDYPFHQDPNFYYLSGCIEPNALLMVYKDTQETMGVKYNELLFIQERNPNKELWTGRILGTREAPQLLGITTVLKKFRTRKL